MLNYRFYDFLQNNNISCKYQESCESTNNWAKTQLNFENHKLEAFLCDFQTSGKGRFDRTWDSSNINGQLFTSWCFPVSEASMFFPPIVGSFLHQSIKELAPELRLKIPNDIYFQGKKVAGILCEMISSNNHLYLIVGVGWNLQAKPEIDSAGQLNLKKEEENIFFKSYLEAILKIKNFSMKNLEERLSYLVEHAYIKDKQKILDIDRNFNIKTSNSTFSWSDL